MAAAQTQLRVLAALRQSKHRKGYTPDTSPELQREHVNGWAASKGYRVIGEAEDLDVSGSKIAPWKRPELGAWLRDRMDEFDAIAIDSVDRAGRDVEDYLAFQSKYLRPHGKSLHFVTPDVDLSTPEGEHIALSLMAHAQLVARQHGDKMSDVNGSVRAKGQHPGGLVPYGYRLVKFDAPGYGYDQDPQPAAIVRQMADRYLSGTSLNAIVRWLNAREVPSPRGKRWSAESVRHILTSPAVAGIMTKAGERVSRKYRRSAKTEHGPLYSATGEMVTMVTAPGVPVEGIVKVSEWQSILATVKANGHNGPRSNGSNLLRVAYCGNCGLPLYSAPQTSKGRTYRYLKCSRKTRPEIPGECSNPVIHAEDVEKAIERAIIRELGDVEMRTKRVTPADDKGKALEFVETQLAGLVEAIVNGTMSPALAGAAEARLRDKREQLIKEAHPEKVDWEPSGITFGQHWRAMNWTERHAWLVANGVVATVMPAATVEWGPDSDELRAELGTALRRTSVHLGDLEQLRESAVTS